MGNYEKLQKIELDKIWFFLKFFRLNPFFRSIFKKKWKRKITFVFLKISARNICSSFSSSQIIYYSMRWDTLYWQKISPRCSTVETFWRICFKMAIFRDFFTKFYCRSFLSVCILVSQLHTISLTDIISYSLTSATSSSR